MEMVYVLSVTYFTMDTSTSYICGVVCSEVEAEKWCKKDIPGGFLSYESFPVDDKIEEVLVRSYSG